MRTTSFPVASSCLAFLLLAGFSRSAVATTPEGGAGALMQRADAAYAEKSYAIALGLYRDARPTAPPYALDEITFRIATCLVASRRWDEGLSSVRYGLKHTQWKARLHYLLGRYYAQVPHEGYQVGSLLYRGGDVPTVKGAQKPVEVELYSQDAAASLQNLEKAKVEAQAERSRVAQRQSAEPEHALRADEEIDLNFDLAATLPPQESQSFIASMPITHGGDENLDPKQPYNPSWAMPKKVLYLYNEVPFLDRSASRHQTALAVLAKGLFVRSYQDLMEGWKGGIPPVKVLDSAGHDDLAAEALRNAHPYPFERLDALAIWQDVPDRFRGDPIAPKTEYLIAQTLEQKGNRTAAYAAYGKVLTAFPASTWADDAKAARWRLTQNSVSFYLAEPAKPGQEPKLDVTAKNSARVDFVAYRVKLDQWVLRDKVLHDPKATFTSFAANFGSTAQARRQLGAPVAHWSWKTGDKGKLEEDAGVSRAPLKAIGAYLVIASVPGKRMADVVIISDLGLIEKSEDKRTFAWVVNALTGNPESGVAVTAKETWYTYGDGAPQTHCIIKDGVTDSKGFFDYSYHSRTESGDSATFFAHDGERYALTPSQQQAGDGEGGAYDYRALPYTDRPVYRPGQRVFFRQIVTRRPDGGDWKPMVKERVAVSVTNPAGEPVFAANLVTSEFGTVNGSFLLPAPAPLGEYSLVAQPHGIGPESDSDEAGDQSFNCQFRVEEYKRPEFLVTVSAPTKAARPGDTVAARINARYYFGAPVPNATVKYTVRRSNWWADYQFPEPFDWLYQAWGAGQYDTGRRNIGGEGSGTIVKEGTVQTDASGNAELSFATAPIDNAKANVSDDAANTSATSNASDSYLPNPLYTVEAQVTDASRRTIEAQGEVKVADQQYFAFLHTARDYYLAGDRVPIEVHTQDANGQPLAQTGNMVVYRLLPFDKEEKVSSEAVSTDAKGRAFWNWKQSVAGEFRVAFEGTDAWGKKVSASATLWIAGSGFDSSLIRLQGVTILLDKRYYSEDDTLHALLVADQPGATVLFTQEVGAKVLQRDVIKIDGKSRQVDIPVTHHDMPNFFLAAALIQNYQVFQTQEEVFVPPVRELLHISATADKASYKPGETGTFSIKATDYAGNPARAEVSLALIDASLFYVQKDYAPDLRQFYYADRRTDVVVTDSHLSGNIEQQSENDDQTVPKQERSFQMPDDLGLLNLPLTVGVFEAPGEYGAGKGSSRATMSSSPMLDSAPARALADTSRAGHASSDVGFLDGKLSSPAPAAPAPEIRSNFAETALWAPAVVTENGKATVKVTFPDSLTQWHATARGLTTSVQVGSDESDVATKKELIVRLQAPRFFVQRDEAVITANVHNYSSSAQLVHVTLKLSGALTLGTGAAEHLAAMAQGTDFLASSGDVDLPAGAESRVNWLCEAKGAGASTIEVAAQTPTDSDGVRMPFQVLVHGVERASAQGGILRDIGSARVNVTFPALRRHGASQLNLQLNPSLAATMLDALPYLSDYPYGCVEQTMSRFLPAVIAQKTLADSGINLTELRQRAAAYAAEAKATAVGLNVEDSGYTYPQGMPNSRNLEEMSRDLPHSDRWNGPVFDPGEMRRTVNEGLARLSSMQRSDGGWGWWPDSAESDEYMSAYVVYGLAMAKAADVPVPAGELERGFAYLEQQIKVEENLHLLAYMSYSLSLRGQLPPGVHQLVAGRLFEQRERLSAYSQSLLAMALWNTGEREKAGTLMRNLKNSVVLDESNGTGHWPHSGEWWCWWNNDDETDAVVLRAFLLIDPTNRLTAMVMKRLTLAARANHWSSTKATAEAVYSLAQYVRQFHELDVDYTLKVTLNGNLARSYHVTRDNSLFFDNRFLANDRFLRDGINTVSIEKQGRGNLYWNAYSQYFSLEEPIEHSGNEIGITRRYFKLTRNPEVPATPTQTPAAPDALDTTTGAPILAPVAQTQQEFVRHEIKDGAVLGSGDLIEVELSIQSHNDYSYLVFEDMKPAGLEPVDLRSGTAWGDDLCSNVELRDEKVAFFVDELTQGQHVLRYQMRAEVPGRFHALPTNGYAMYAPEVRAISDETRMAIRDK